MWYKIDFYKLAFNWVMVGLRKPLELSFYYSMLRPLVSLNYLWNNNRTDTIYKIENTGQICYLRGSLNDGFDPIERRIYIGDGQLYDTTYIFTEAEEQELWMDTEPEPDTIWIRTAGETADTGLDFIVYVPQALYDGQIDALKAHINYYRAAGKRYNIFIDE